MEYDGEEIKDIGNMTKVSTNHDSLKKGIVLSINHYTLIPKHSNNTMITSTLRIMMILP